MKYPTLDSRIEQTYAKRSTATNKNSLYDSYIRAFRWATDRIGDHGVVGFVSNGGWIDGNTADGMRLSLADDYSAIYVYNLRGNQRTAGELSRKEGGKVFGGGSRNTVAIFIGAKDPKHVGSCQIFYRDIGDYLSREDKLRIIGDGHLDTLDWEKIAPNTHGDWVNQRDDTFSSWPVIGDKKPAPGATTVFSAFSRGLETGRDAWVYNYSRNMLRACVNRLIDSYNGQLEPFDEYCQRHAITRPDEKAVTSYLGETPAAADEQNIKWSRSLRTSLARSKALDEQSVGYVFGVYRPFSKQCVYFDRYLNHERSQLPSMFPTPHHSNVGFYCVGAGSDVPFSVLMLNDLPNLHVTGAGSGGQFFPRWTYVKAESPDGGLDFTAADTPDVDEYGYRRVDNITDGILKLYRKAIGEQVTKDDIFYYVYGLLHDPGYRETYAADLKKMLPHIPTPESRERFDQVADAGRRLAGLHVGYEAVDPYPLEVQLKPGTDPNDRETWRVQKMRWLTKADHSAIIYNPKVTIAGIPGEAERYMLGSRSALGWIIDRYQVATDKSSGIVNDPNDWCDEHDDPTYIVDLIKKVTTVSIGTMKIVDSLAETVLL
ncbi:type ISP restriction/modification enzyme [Mycobacterium celatum]|uniref:type ISP restriction/modification enzyme n=1 Tax=Mycobacterium celatum TaxID=28045 RepID=UPI000A62E672